MDEYYAHDHRIRQVALTDAQEVKTDAQADVVTGGECECTATAYDIVRHGSNERSVCLSCAGDYNGEGSGLQERSEERASPRPLLPWVVLGVSGTEQPSIPD